MVLFVLNTGIWEIDENTFQVKKITDGKNLICQNIYGTSFIRNGDELQIFFRLKKSIFTYHLKTHTITVESFLKNSSDKILTSTSILPNGNAILAATINNKDYLVEYNKSKKLIVRQKEVEKLTLDPFYKNCLYIKSVNKIIVNDYFKGLIFYDTAFNKTDE